MADFGAKAHLPVVLLQDHYLEQLVDMHSRAIQHLPYCTASINRLRSDTELVPNCRTSVWRVSHADSETLKRTVVASRGRSVVSSVQLHQ